MRKKIICFEKVVPFVFSGDVFSTHSILGENAMKDILRKEKIA